MSLFIDGIIFSLQKRGGITTYFRELARYLKNNNTSFTIGLNNPTAEGVADFLKNSRPFITTSRFLERYRYCRLPANVKVFHSSYYRIPELLDVPTVVTVHDFIYERRAAGLKKWVHSSQKRSAIVRAQAIICVSAATRDDLLEYIGVRPEQHLYVIHNGVSPTYRPIGLPFSGRPYILFVGQRGWYKNFRLVLDAMEFLPEFDLHCVGGGALQTFEIAGLSSSVLGRIKKFNYISSEELNIKYNQAVCLVHPSQDEGFGLPVLEAMRAGCPVVAVECKAVLEVGGDSIEVVDFASPPAVAESVLRMLDPELRKLRIEAGYKKSANFSWDKCHGQTLDVYRSLGLDSRP